jgi:hypothetical protein
MKYLLLFLLLPFFAPCQTVHLEKDRIAYKGKVKVEHASAKELAARAKAALLLHVKAGKESSLTEDNAVLRMEGKIRLKTAYSVIRNVHYMIQIDVQDGGYEYHIDSVYVKERERTGKSTLIPSEDLVKNMEVTGPVASQTEKLLNEIDMHLQKLLALIEADMKRPSNPLP